MICCIFLAHFKPIKHTTGNAPTMFEAYTQTIQPNNPQLDNVEQTMATTRLSKENEVMIGDQLSKSNHRIKELKYTMSQQKNSKIQKDSFGQTKLDISVRAAANVVKKLKPISLLPLVKKEEEIQKTTLQKWATPQLKLTNKDINERSFYDHIYKVKILVEHCNLFGSCIATYHL